MNNRIIRKAIFILLPVTICICFYCIFHDELSAGATPVFTLLMSFASVLSIAGLLSALLNHQRYSERRPPGSRTPCAEPAAETEGTAEPDSCQPPTADTFFAGKCTEGSPYI